MNMHTLTIEIDPKDAADADRIGVDLALASALGVQRELAIRRNALKTDAERALDAKAWAEENAVALEAHRKRIERDGIFGEDLRTW